MSWSFIADVLSLILIIGGSVLTLTRGVRGVGRLGGVAGAATTVFAGSGNRSLLRGIVELARARD